MKVEKPRAVVRAEKQQTASADCREPCSPLYYEWLNDLVISDAGRWQMYGFAMQDDRKDQARTDHEEVQQAFSVSEYFEFTGDLNMLINHNAPLTPQ